MAIIRIVVADDHPVVLAGIKALIQAAPEIELGEHGKVWEAVLSMTGETGLGEAFLSQNYLWEALPYPQQTATIPPPPTLCHAPAVQRARYMTLETIAPLGDDTPIMPRAMEA